MKILAVNWRDRGDPMGGGAEVHLHETLRRLVARGHQVTWLACAYPGAPEQQIGDDGIRYRRRGKWELANWVLPGLLRDELSANDYDVVLEDINKLPFYAPLHTRLPVLAVVPHLFGSTVYRETNALLATYVVASELPIPWVYRRCRFLAISRSTADDLARRGIAHERIEVIECGMDHDRYARAQPPPRSRTPLLIHLGRLRRYKSIDVAIAATALIREQQPEVALHIVGDGPDRPRLQREARRLGIEAAVHFEGFLPRDRVVDLLYRSHVCLNPSPKEGWGLTVIEANECGVPVVASRRPGLSDSVREGQTGWLVEYGDEHAFARRTLDLLSDPPTWRAFSENAVRWARGFSWDRAAERTEELLLRCIRDGR